MSKVSLEQWRMFKAVVEHGGFNQASKQVFKSQSSIHTAIGKIEHTLGVKLFKVEGRKTILTSNGRLMLRRAEYLLNEANKLEAVGETLGKGVESSLRVAVDEILSQKSLYDALHQVSIEYPNLQVELVETILSGAQESLENLTVDIAISPYKPANAYSEPLCNVEFLLVAHPEHPLHQLDRKLTLEDLKSHRQIVIRDSSILNKKNEGWLGANQRWTVTHLHTSINMIASGLGYAWLPLLAIQKYLDGGQLKALPMGEFSARSASLFLSFQDVDALGPAAHAFIRQMKVCSAQQNNSIK